MRSCPLYISLRMHHTTRYASFLDDLLRAVAIGHPPSLVPVEAVQTLKEYASDEEEAAEDPEPWLPEPLPEYNPPPTPEERAPRSPAAEGPHPIISDVADGRTSTRGIDSPLVRQRALAGSRAPSATPLIHEIVSEIVSPDPAPPPRLPRSHEPAVGKGSTPRRAPATMPPERAVQRRLRRTAVGHRRRRGLALYDDSSDEDAVPTPAPPPPPRSRPKTVPALVRGGTPMPSRDSFCRPVSPVVAHGPITLSRVSRSPLGGPRLSPLSPLSPLSHSPHHPPGSTPSSPSPNSPPPAPVASTTTSFTSAAHFTPLPLPPRTRSPPSAAARSLGSSPPALACAARCADAARQSSLHTAPSGAPPEAPESAGAAATPSSATETAELYLTRDELGSVGMGLRLTAASPPLIDSIEPGGAAAAAGVAIGDRILAVNGRMLQAADGSFLAMPTMLTAGPAAKLALLVERSAAASGPQAAGASSVRKGSDEPLNRGRTQLRSPRDGISTDDGGSPGLLRSSSKSFRAVHGVAEPARADLSTPAQHRPRSVQMSTERAAAAAAVFQTRADREWTRDGERRQAEACELATQSMQPAHSMRAAAASPRPATTPLCNRPLIPGPFDSITLLSRPTSRAASRGACQAITPQSRRLLLAALSSPRPPAGGHRGGGLLGRAHRASLRARRGFNLQASLRNGPSRQSGKLERSPPSSGPPTAVAEMGSATVADDPHDTEADGGQRDWTPIAAPPRTAAVPLTFGAVFGMSLTAKLGGDVACTAWDSLSLPGLD